MKDNRAWACVLLCALPLGAAGLVLQLGTPAALPRMMPEPRSDVLEFVDGSALHGKLAGMDPEGGLTWSNAHARNPIHFRPAHLDFIRFAGEQSVRLSPTCHLWFGNGDDLYGSITSLDNERVGFQSWLGTRTAIPRTAVTAITFLPTNYSVAYEGPYHDGGWVVANLAPKSWTFRDGCFVGTGPGTLGRDLNLTNSATLEFDLAWRGVFLLEADIYCDVTSGVEIDVGSCVMDITPRQFTLRQPWNTSGAFHLPGEPPPGDQEEGQSHVAIECDRTAKTVTLFVNHILAKTWDHCNVGRGGTGVLFRQQINVNPMSGSAVRLSHIKVSQWQGRGEPETLPAATNTDGLQFINHDRAFGTIESIHDGKARLALSGKVLEIPLERVTQMEFARGAAPAEASGPWEVRAHFPGGGSLSFQLEKWDGGEISGRSAILGPLALQPGAIREMEFNLNRPKEKEDGGGVDMKEFQGLDE